MARHPRGEADPDRSWSVTRIALPARWWAVVLGAAAAAALVLSDAFPAAARGRRIALGAGAGRPLALAVTPGGGVVAATGGDGRVWLRVVGRPFVAPPAFAGFCAAVSPDASVLVAGRASAVTVWDIDSGRARRVIDPGRGWVSAVAVEGGRGDAAVAVACGGEISLWDAATGRRLRVLAAPGLVECLAFTPGGSSLVAGGRDGFLTAWDTASGSELVRVRASPWPLTALAFSGDGRTLVTASTAVAHARLWDARTWRPLAEFEGDGPPVQGVALTRSGERAAAATADGAVLVWDARSGRRLVTFPGAGTGTAALAFAPDGRSLAVCDQTGHVTLHDRDAWDE